MASRYGTLTEAEQRAAYDLEMSYRAQSEEDQEVWKRLYADREKAQGEIGQVIAVILLIAVIAVLGSLGVFDGANPEYRYP